MHKVQTAIQAEASVSIAHELNQPLNAAMNFTEGALKWLQRDIPDIEEAVAAIEASISAIARASDVVKSVRRLLNHVSPELTQIGVDRAITDMLQLMAIEASSANVAVRVDLHCAGVRICADYTMLQQVLVNLVTNALQSLSEVEDRETILEIETRIDGKWVVIGVQDNGAGFAPDAKVRAFEPFYSTKRDGMGVGLAICRSIIAIHGGEIALGEVNPGPGARVEVRLPIALH
jgi:C4-dicarboxylate-specific signal transduction histidine kinase